MRHGLNVIPTSSQWTTKNNDMFYTKGRVGINTDSLTDLTNYNTPDIERKNLEGTRRRAPLRSELSTVTAVSSFNRMSARMYDCFNTLECTETAARLLTK